MGFKRSLRIGLQGVGRSDASLSSRNGLARIKGSGERSLTPLKTGTTEHTEGEEGPGSGGPGGKEPGWDSNAHFESAFKEWGEVTPACHLYSENAKSLSARRFHRVRRVLL